MKYKMNFGRICFCQLQNKKTIQLTRGSGWNLSTRDTYPDDDRLELELAAKFALFIAPISTLCSSLIDHRKKNAKEKR